MLKFRRGPKPGADIPAPSVGRDRRVYAIGDIHGRDDLLAELLDRIARDDAGRDPLPRTLILLGDLVDRGPDSARVVERAMALARSGEDVRFIKGNHEEVFVAAARGDEQAARAFRPFGGVETVASYGLDPTVATTMTPTELARWMLTNVPREHVDFLDDFADNVTMDDYLFVHAGVRPKVPMEAQRPEDLRWIREPFLSYMGSHGKMIVHGHSITTDVDVHANRIGIDTGAYFSGKLTAIGLEGDRRWFLETGGPL